MYIYSEDGTKSHWHVADTYSHQLSDPAQSKGQANSLSYARIALQTDLTFGSSQQQGSQHYRLIKQIQLPRISSTTPAPTRGDSRWKLQYSIQVQESHGNAEQDPECTEHKLLTDPGPDAAHIYGEDDMKMKTDTSLTTVNTNTKKDKDRNPHPVVTYSLSFPIQVT